MTASNPSLGAVVFVNDLSRVTAFYEHVVAARVVLRDADHAVLEIGASRLVVHAIPPHIAATIEIREPPQRREDSALKLTFPVKSIAQARELAARFGGVIDGPEREWQYSAERGRTKICDGHDPEGNVIQLREE